MKLNLPDAICVVRIVGSGALSFLSLGGASAGQLVCIVLLLLLSDVVDGLVARRLKIQSRVGAVLDSFADACFYSAAVFAVWQRNPSYLEDNSSWLVTAFVSYVINVVFSLLKFRRWPSYHTYLAKVALATATVGIVGGLLDWDDLLVQTGTGVFVAANLEQTLITAVLRSPQQDLGTLFAALRTR